MKSPMSGLIEGHTMKKLLLLLLTVSVATAFAAPVDSATLATHRAKIDAAIAAGDYDAWKAEHDAFSRGKGGAKVTRENFPTYVKMRQAQTAGRTEEAAALRTELGMGQGQGAGKGQGMRARKGGQGAMGQGMKGAGAGQGKGRKGQGCQRKQ